MIHLESQCRYETLEVGKNYWFVTWGGANYWIELIEETDTHIQGWNSDVIITAPKSEIYDLHEIGYAEFQQH